MHCQLSWIGQIQIANLSDSDYPLVERVIYSAKIFSIDLCTAMASRFLSTAPFRIQCWMWSEYDPSSSALYGRISTAFYGSIGNCLERTKLYFFSSDYRIAYFASDCLRAGNKASVLHINSNYSKKFLVFDACPGDKQISVQYSFVNAEGDKDQKPRINPDYFL